MKEKNTSPIIIIGMHRSGTTLISSVLEELGLFSGCKKENNNESLFFLRINNWLLNQCGASWDNPLPFNEALKNAKYHMIFTRHLEKLMATHWTSSYLGWPGYLRYKSLKNMRIPWSWKDPRNTFTLPLWLSVFPSAKVIHVIRHGIDVANSLLKREEKGTLKIVESSLRKRLHLQPLPYDRYFTPRCNSLEGGFSLWSEYVTQARANLTLIDESNTHEVIYEDFLQNPVDTLSSLITFCGIDVQEQQIHAIVSKIKFERKLAYKTDSRLLEFAKEHSSILKQFGYGSNG